MQLSIAVELEGQHGASHVNSPIAIHHRCHILCTVDLICNYRGGAKTARRFESPEKLAVTGIAGGELARSFGMKQDIASSCHYAPVVVGFKGMAPFVGSSNGIESANVSLRVRPWASLFDQTATIFSLTPAETKTSFANLIRTSLNESFIERVEVGDVVVVKVH